MSVYKVRVSDDTECIIEAEFVEITDGVAIFYSGDPPQIVSVFRQYDHIFNMSHYEETP